MTNQQLGASIILDAQGAVLSAAYTDSGMGPTGVEDAPAQAFRLEQNYPNPFSGSTSIAYELERPGHVTLSVFDLMGREVTRLIDAQLPTGSHRAHFGAGKLPSGVYFYRLQVDGSAALRQLVLQR